jgi:hypothetical protein
VPAVAPTPAIATALRIVWRFSSRLIRPTFVQFGAIRKAFGAHPCSDLLHRLPMSRRSDPAEGVALTVTLEEFATEALEAEARRQGVRPEEVAAYAISYYLADRDSGRIAHRVPRFARPGSTADTDLRR